MVDGARWGDVCCRCAGVGHRVRRLLGGWGVFWGVDVGSLLSVEECCGGVDRT